MDRLDGLFLMPRARQIWIFVMAVLALALSIVAVRLAWRDRARRENLLMQMDMIRMDIEQIEALQVSYHKRLKRLEDGEKPHHGGDSPSER